MCLMCLSDIGLEGKGTITNKSISALWSAWLYVTTISIKQITDILKKKKKFPLPVQLKSTSTVTILSPCGQIWDGRKSAL